MEWLVVIAFLVLLAGLGAVVWEALGHKHK
jgi:hypothetical protein